MEITLAHKFPNWLSGCFNEATAISCGDLALLRKTFGDSVASTRPQRLAVEIRRIVIATVSARACFNEATAISCGDLGILAEGKVDQLELQRGHSD